MQRKEWNTTVAFSRYLYTNYMYRKLRGEQEKCNNDLLWSVNTTHHTISQLLNFSLTKHRLSKVDFLQGTIVIFYKNLLNFRMWIIKITIVLIKITIVSSKTC